MYETRDPYAIKAGVVEEIAINSCGDEFLDVLLRHQRETENDAKKCNEVLRKAETANARALGKADAVRAAVVAYRQAITEREADR